MEVVMSRELTLFSSVLQQWKCRYGIRVNVSSPKLLKEFKLNLGFRSSPKYIGRIKFSFVSDRHNLSFI
jgi:hypothetical protein